MTIKQQAKIDLDNIVELANHLCPYKGEDDIESEFNAIPIDAPISVKRSCWVDGFLNALITVRRIEDSLK